MSGIYFAIFCVGILLLVHWYIRNDKGENDDGSRGFFAVRVDVPSQQRLARFVSDEHSRVAQRPNKILHGD